MSFYTYAQNNVDGYFIEDKERGVGSYIIIEANSRDEADIIFEKIGEPISDFDSYCDCCGSRWYGVDDDTREGTDIPLIAGDIPYNFNRDFNNMFRRYCFTHYKNGFIHSIDLLFEGDYHSKDLPYWFCGE